MRAHYIAQYLAARSDRTYRQLLLETWRDIYPTRPAYVQLLSNRVRWILANQKLSQAELERIKNTCFPTVQLTVEQPVEARRSSVRVRRSGLFVDRVQNDEVERAFLRNLMSYSGMTPECRPRIPKLDYSRAVLERLQSLNTTLPKHLNNVKTLEQVVSVVYAGAATICEMNGQKLQQRNAHHHTMESSIPPWKARLQREITRLRKKIGIVHTYLSNPAPSTRVVKAVRKVASEFRIKRRDPMFGEKISLRCDTMKQKIKVLGLRIRRYNEKVKRHNNNRLFFKNQKQFFRNLEQKKEHAEGHLDSKTAHQYWSKIWSENVTYDDQAYWIEEAQETIPRAQMQDLRIEAADITEALKGLNNWAAPGADGLHNYWWKHLSSVHGPLSEIFQAALSDPSGIPNFFTKGITHLIKKKGDSRNPENYRPITCLPSVYKIFTSILAKYIGDHLRQNNLMAEEQSGCRMKTKGSKELLVVDYILTKQARKRLRNISVAWVDYRKAFDSIPHSWLLRVLRMHGIADNIITALEGLMKTWKTSLQIRAGDLLETSDEIRIQRGIFQGDSLSPVWFCLALNPLSMLLNNTKYGYVIDKQQNIRTNHNLYMDDLKIYAASMEQLRRLLEIVAAFSESINMQLGIEKCAVLEVKRGKIQETQHQTLINNVTIPALDDDGTYKYLGINQALEIRTSEMKKMFKDKLYARLRLLMKTGLNSKAFFTAVNIWAIPSMMYSFGVLTWSRTELREMDRAVRATLTRYGVHHPHSSNIRLYLKRQQGGRGLLNLEAAHDKHIDSLRGYFHESDSPFLQAICRADENCSALGLSNRADRLSGRSSDELIEEWKSKALHGRYASLLKSEHVNEVESLSYLRAGYLLPETEGRLIAMQDQVMPTRMYLKHIAKQDIPSDRCRRCFQAPESIQHLTSSCSVMAPRDYMDRHNAMAKIYHQHLALKLGLLCSEEEHYRYQPKSLLESSRYKLYWDATLITDGAVAHNRPDIALFDLEQKTCVLLDVTIPVDDNIPRAYSQKISKYNDLAFQLRALHNLKGISILPLIISTNGLVEKRLIENTRELGLDQTIISLAQKQVLLNTVRIVRKCLQGQ